MTVEEKTMDKRYQVHVRFMGNDESTVVNAYSRRQVAAKCAAVLADPLRPDKFVDAAWVVDTLADLSDGDILAVGA